MEAKGAALRLGFLPALTWQATTAGKAIKEVIGGGLSIGDHQGQQAWQELAVRANEGHPALLELWTLRTNAGACCDELFASWRHCFAEAGGRGAD